MLICRRSWSFVFIDERDRDRDRQAGSQAVREG